MRGNHDLADKMIAYWLMKEESIHIKRQIQELRRNRSTEEAIPLDLSYGRLERRR